MNTKQIRQKYFVSKEIRTSIALIILWSLLVTAFFTYFAKELGEKIGSGTLLFAIIMVGYLIIVVVLTMLFSHRLVGPFQRLKTEMRLIVAGDYHRRLNVRTSDDVYIRSFITEVNRILEDYAKVRTCNDELIQYIDAELMTMISLIEEGEGSKERLRDHVLGFHKKMKLSEEKYTGHVSTPEGFPH